MGYVEALAEQQQNPNEFLSSESYPCLFRLGNSFYDFTPFKLANNVWPAVWANNTAPAQGSLQNSYQYQFSFCLMMNEAANATCATQNYAIGSTFDLV